MGAIIADFGKNEEGLNLFRINGTKTEIFDAVDKFLCLGCEIYTQELEKSHKHWSILLKMKIPEND